MALDGRGAVVPPALLWNDVRSAGAALDLVTELGYGQAWADVVLGRLVSVPRPDEHLADGAAHQAAWVLTGGQAPPAWPLPDVVHARPTPRRACASAPKPGT